MPCPKALFRQSKSRHSKSTTRPVTTVFLLTRSTPCKSRTLRSQGRVPYLRCPIGERWIDYSRYRRFISFKSIMIHTHALRPKLTSNEAYCHDLLIFQTL